MAHDARASGRANPPDEMVNELTMTARAIGIDEADLAMALADGQIIAEIAQARGMKPRQAVRALVSHVVASVADDIRRGALNADQVTWLVALATWYAEQQVTRAGRPAGDLLPQG